MDGTSFFFSLSPHSSPLLHRLPRLLHSPHSFPSLFSLSPSRHSLHPLRPLSLSPHDLLNLLFSSNLPNLLFSSLSSFFGFFNVIAFLDTGIRPSHRAFHDADFPSDLPHWNGLCQSGPLFPLSSYNRKLARHNTSYASKTRKSFGSHHNSFFFGGSPTAKEGEGAQSWARDWHEVQNRRACASSVIARRMTLEKLGIGARALRRSPNSEFTSSVRFRGFLNCVDCC